MPAGAARALTDMSNARIGIATLSFVVASAHEWSPALRIAPTCSAGVRGKVVFTVPRFFYYSIYSIVAYVF